MLSCNITCYILYLYIYYIFFKFKNKIYKKSYNLNLKNNSNK